MIGKKGINHRKTIAQHGFCLKYIRYLIIFRRYPFIFTILPLKRVGFQKPQNTKKMKRSWILHLFCLIKRTVIEFSYCFSRRLGVPAPKTIKNTFSHIFERERFLFTSTIILFLYTLSIYFRYVL